MEQTENQDNGSDDGLLGVSLVCVVEIPPPRSSDRRPRKITNPDDPRDAEVVYERAVASSAAQELARVSSRR
ncbi:hypothetical protein IT408_00200 [Candidatus Uhrbacteria bacterium]|nr:hypothetical protein [Candidatus Uhrbacteria bacterium]